LGGFRSKEEKILFPVRCIVFSSVVSIYSDLNFTAKERLCGELKYCVNLSLDV